LVGQIVEVEAKIAHTGSTSMQIFIQVRCGDPKTQNMVETNHCVISFVAMDETGYPIEVPAFKAQTEEDIKLENYAIKMKQIAIETENLLHKV
jgi:acyl-CoA hydrolase